MRKRPKIYQIIVKDLLQRINNGEYEAGDMLTPEHQLATEYGVSRGTIRTALQELANQGVIITRHGTGSFVSKATQGIHFNICDLTSMSAIIQKAGIKPEVKYLSCETRIATEEEVIRFEVLENSKMLELKREVQTEGKMAIVSYDVIRADILPDSFDVSKIGGSIFDFLSSLNCQIVSARTDISAVIGSDFGLCGEAKNESFIGLSQLHYSIDDQPIFYSKTYFRDTLFTFSLMRQKR